MNEKINKREPSVLIGTIAKHVYCNEKTAYNFFLLTDENGRTIGCAGRIQRLPVGIPVMLKGCYEENKNDSDKLKFAFTNYEILDSDEEKEITFIENFKIENLTRSIAKGFVQYFGHVIDTVKDSKVPSVFTERCPDKLKPFARMLFNKIKRVFLEKELFDEILLSGGSYANVCSVIEKYGTLAMSKLHENPYSVGYYCGFDFFVCETIAAKIGMNSLNKKRAEGMLLYALNMIVEEGNTCASIEDLRYALNYLLKEQQIGTMYLEYLLAVAITDDRFVVNNEYVYFRYIWTKQKSFINHYIRLKRSSEGFSVNWNTINALESKAGISLSSSQKNAFNVFGDYGVKIITGGPGAGKTTLTNLLIQYYEQEFPGKGICLCAPTGCAAQNLAVKTNTGAATIHKTLGIQPCSADDLRTTVQISAKLVIVDEASMLDLELAAILLQSIPNDTFVLFIGDADQLPSVGTGNILSDLITAGTETYFLEGTFRQTDGSTITCNAHAINKCNYADIREGEDFNIIEAKTDADVIETCLFAAADSSKKWQVLTPMRKSALGSTEMSRKLQSQLTFSAIKKDYGQISYHINDRVLTIHNNYSIGYYNGEQGIVTGISEDDVTITFEDGNIVLIPNKDLKDMTLSYAMTIHKSQGAEYDNIIILLPTTANMMCSKNLLYTAVTRAKKKVVIISQRGQLKRTVERLQKPRNSELPLLLKQKQYS